MDTYRGSTILASEYLSLRFRIKPFHYIGSHLRTVVVVVVAVNAAAAAAVVVANFACRVLSAAAMPVEAVTQAEFLLKRHDKIVSLHHCLSMMV